MDARAGEMHIAGVEIRDSDMQKITPYLVNARPKTCWGCGQPFTVRQGHAEAIVGPDGRLYCHRFACEQTALVAHVCELQRAA
jgi:hypothetical protein